MKGRARGERVVVAVHVLCVVWGAAGVLLLTFSKDGSSVMEGTQGLVGELSQALHLCCRGGSGDC